MQLTATAIGWEAGHVGAKAFQRKPGGAVELPDAGDFEKDQAFSCGAWVKLPAARPDRRRSSPAWTTSNDYRGWDLWLENGKRRHAHRQQVAGRRAQGRRRKTPLPAGRVAPRLSSPTTARARPPASRSTSTASRRPTDVAGRHAARTRSARPVPFKVGQRHTGDAARRASRSRTCGSTAARCRAEEVEQLAARHARRLARRPKPADKRTAGREATSCSTGGWPALDEPYRRRSTPSSPTLQEEEAAIKAARHRSPTSCRRSPSEPMAFVLFRGDYDKRRDQVKADTPAALPPMPADLPRNRLGLAQWLLRPEHPLTARVTVNRFWQELFGTGLVRTAGDFGVTGELPCTPSCSTGWRSSSARAGWDVSSSSSCWSRPPTYRQSAVGDAGEAGEGPATTGCSRAGRGSAWTPRWSATTPSPPAACWSRRSAARASSRTSPTASGRPSR